MDTNTTIVFLTFIVVIVAAVVYVSVLQYLYRKACEQIKELQNSLAVSKSELATLQNQLDGAKKTIEILKKSPQEVLDDAFKGSDTSSDTHPV